MKKPPSVGGRVMAALGLGFLTTILTIAASQVAAANGAVRTARALFWEGELAGALAPPFNIGTPPRPVYEGTVVQALVGVACTAFGFCLYSVVAFIALRWIFRRPATGAISGCE